MLERIVLFDIDGTILHAGKPPARAILRAMEEVFQVSDLMPPRGEYSFSGKTDPEIVMDLLARKGYPTEKIAAGLEEVFDRYIFYLKTTMGNGNDAYLHPGVMILIRRLAEDKKVLLGLLTGNIEEGARIKLDHFGIAGYFPIGAYGSDSPERNRLPEIALNRVKKLTGLSYGGRNVVIIGDSVYDIRCARSVGAVAIGVATGTTSCEALRAERPDHLFQDLSQTDHVLDTIAP